MITLFEATLLVAILLTAVATAIFRDVLSAIIVFSAYSLGMAIIYTFLLAPDVAMTEAAISAGVTTILLLLTIAKTSRPPTDELFEEINVPALVVVGVFALVLGAAAIPEMPAVGDPDAIAWANPDVTQYYLENTYSDTGVQNSVAAVLAAYRGFDTFGEAVVVFGAAVAVLLVLHREVFA
jgi:multicomponent Na+:H+ antiporter subunit B